MNRKYFLHILFFVLSLLIFNACDLTPDDEPKIPITSNKHLIAYGQVTGFPKAFIKPIIDSLESNLGGIDVEFSDKVKYDVRVYKMTYKTKFKNDEVVASGLVCVPQVPDGVAVPLLSFQNGTNTLHSKAPTNDYSSQFFTLLEMVSSFGYVIAIPDYLGFGASSTMFHPYLDKPSTVSSVTDMLRAIREMTSDKYLDMNLSKDTYLLGYSQGGWASMALKKEMETNLQDEFTLKGTVAGAGPYDQKMLLNSMLEVPEYPMPVYLAYLFHSMIKVGNVKITLTDIFNPPYDTRIPGLFNGQRDNDYINGQLSTKTSELFVHGFRTNPDSIKYVSLIEESENNSIEPWNSTTPLLMMHGTSDTYVPVSQSESLYEKLLEQGTSEQLVDYMPIPGMDHLQAASPFTLVALKWILDMQP